MEPGHMAIDRRGSRDRIPLDTSSSRRRAAGVWAVLAASLACLLPASAAGAAPSLHPRLARRVEPALIIAGSGTIEGTVSSSETKAPLGEVEVCAIEREVLSEGVEGEALPFEECTITDASGDYTLEVPAREYYVEFYPLPETGLDYQTQFYNGKARFFDADPVNVMAGQVTSGIDAALLSGGEISGTVTSAVTKGPVAEVLVCAFGKASESGNCAMDGPNGEYTVPGLAGGSYVVIFEPFGEEAEISYALQFYTGKAREVEAAPVEAVVGENTPNIDAVLQKDVPRARSQPGVAGDAAVAS